MISRSAKSCATRKNKKVRQALPLFSDQVLESMNLLTTPEAEQIRIDQCHDNFKNWLEEQRQRHAYIARRSIILYRWAQIVLYQHELDHVRYMIQCCPKTTEYAADILNNALADHLKLPRLQVSRSLEAFCQPLKDRM